MTAITPNPFSPFADADPEYRHLLAVPAIFGMEPGAGTLYPTGCDRLAVVPERITETKPSADLPDGLCPLCVAVMRTGHPLEDSRGAVPCRECSTTTRHDGLCALCRQELHDEWWPNRDDPRALRNDDAEV